MKVSVNQISELVAGSVEGNGDLMITGPSQIEYGGATTISFVANPKYLSHAYTTKAGAVIIDKSIALEQEIPTTLIRVENAYESFSKVLAMFAVDFTDKSGVEEGAFVHPSANIGENVYIGAGAYIGEDAQIADGVKVFPNSFVGEAVTIAKDTVLYSNVNIYHHCHIGERCVFHSGVVIGSDGFGFANTKTGEYNKVPQTGNVIIEDDVEIGSNSSIDRATMASTIIRKGVKLDNLIQIAHNVEIGENTVVAAQTGISGSTKIGRNCIIAGQVGIVGHIEIADGTMIGAQSGVSRATDTRAIISGSPAIAHKENLKSQAIYRKLPDLLDRVKDLEEELKKIKAQ